MVDVPQAPVAQPDETLLPDIIEQEENSTIVSGYELDELSEGDKELFEEAQGTLENAFEGYTIDYFLFTIPPEGSTAMPATFNLEDTIVDALVIKQYINKAWVNTPYSGNPDGTITVPTIYKGPMVMAHKENGGGANNYDN